MLAIQSIGLAKHFRNTTALTDVNLEICRGHIHAILGPNGAGKTTFIRILATLLKPTTGRATVFEYDVEKHPDKIKELISLAGQNSSVDEELTGRENLYLISRLLGMTPPAARARVHELLAFFSLKDAEKKLVKNYSGGMRRRLDIAASIVRTPEILFLDEPTTGLDPRSRNRLWNVIREIARNGTTVVLTTQYLDEADQLADRITVMDEGRIISNGTPDELKASVGRNMLHLAWEDSGSTKVDELMKIVAAVLPNQPATLSPAKNTLSVTVSRGTQGTALLSALESQGIPLKSYSLSRPTLDEVFLALTGNRKESALPVVHDREGAAEDSPGADVADRNASVISARGIRHHANVVSDSIMLGWRSLLKVKHIPEQFMDVLITPAMFTFMFAFLLGGALSGSVEHYLGFLVPGMLVQTLTFNSIYSGMTVHTDISKGIFDRLKTMPIWAASPFFGLFVGDCLRHVISGAFLVLFSTLIGFRLETGIHNVLLALLLVIVFALSVSWLFVILGLTMRSISAVMSVGWMILMPLVFLSNIYADPQTMPAWLQTYISINPVTWQVDATRMLFQGEYNATVLIKSLASTLVLTLVFAPIAIQCYRRER